LVIKLFQDGLSCKDLQPYLRKLSVAVAMGLNGRASDDVTELQLYLQILYRALEIIDATLAGECKDWIERIERSAQFDSEQTAQLYHWLPEALNKLGA